MAKTKADRVYNLTMNELLVLLAMKNATSLYGLFEDGFKLPDRRDVNTTIFNMQKKGIIECTDDAIKIPDGLRTSIEGIRDARQVLILTSSNEEVPEICIYKNEYMVYVRQVSGDGDRVRIEPLDVKMTLERILDSEWGLGGNDNELMAKAPVIEESGAGEGLFGIEKDKLIKVDGVKSALLVMNPENGERLNQVLLISQGVEDYIVTDDGSDRMVFPYSNSKIEEIITSILEENI